MNEIIEKLAYRIGEGFQASSLGGTPHPNAFHRNVTTHESSDLSFINGLISTGLRGSASLDGEKIIANYNQLLTASRQHLPLVVNTSSRVVGQSKYSTINNYENINAIQRTGCFQLIASSPQEEVYLTLIAHRIAELSLIPGIVVADYDLADHSSNTVRIPEDAFLRSYLGDPDDQIESPGQAQVMIFGRKRRRIPNWFSLDVPVMLGSKKDGAGMSFEAAANKKYFSYHLPVLIEQAFEEFYKEIEIAFKPIGVKGNSADYAIIAIGGQLNDLFDQIPDEIGKVQLVTINQLLPFPSDDIAELMKGKKAVTILENTSGPDLSYTSFHSNILHAREGKQRVYSGMYGADINATSLGAAVVHMLSNQAKTSYYLGTAFTKDATTYPKHEILLQEIAKQFPDIQRESVGVNAAVTGSSSDPISEVPMAIRMYQDRGPKYSQLARFYDNTAFFYERDEHSELVADPFSAIPVVPASSASFFSHKQAEKSLPVLDTQKCTGCGDCFVHCPHSALPPIAIGIEQLMKAGAKIASSKGAIITKLTPLYKNLAKVASKTIKEIEVASLSDFLAEAFKSLTVQMKLEAEKLEAAQLEFDIVMESLADIPVAITNRFFNTPESIERGSGELFSLAVDPKACTGCSICATVCEEEALAMEVPKTEKLSQLHAQFKVWEQLPDTSADTINRLYHDETYSSLAAMLLCRSYFTTMTGANNPESDSPYKTLLHIVTATTESVVQPKIIEQLKRIDELIDSVSGNIHTTLSQALPKENLENLSKSLKRSSGRKLPLKEIVNQIAGHDQGKLIDSNDLERKTDLVEALKDLKWALSEGPTGIGRSRYGMLLAGSNSLEWTKRFPANNFTCPSLIHWNGSAPDQALGLFYGQLRHLLDNLKLMRRAELESKDKYDPSVHDPEIAALSWDDLTEDEKQRIPPILLVTERDDLNEAGWNNLNKLLADKYPVKIFLLDHVASPNNSPVTALAQTNAGILSAIGLKNAFVFQGGMGNADHLFDGLLDGIDKSYPALFNLYAAKLEKHGDIQIDWSSFASLALNSRSFPALRYDPGTNSEMINKYLSGAISLDGNLDDRQDWVKEEVTVSDDDTMIYEISWADWAFTQQDWKNEFTAVETGTSNLPITDYISLDKKARSAKVPVIMRTGNNELKHYSVSGKVVEMTEAVRSNWNSLQEIAGLLTEFPTKLRTAVTKELSEQYENEAAGLKKEFEQQLKDKEAAQMELLRQQLKEKLVALSRMAQNKPTV